MKGNFANFLANEYGFTLLVGIFQQNHGGRTPEMGYVHCTHVGIKPGPLA